MIDGYNRINQIDKCWEIFRETRHSSKTLADEMLLSYMIRLCSKTHESEKGMTIFAELEQEGFFENSKPYNSIIFALGSTKRHAPQAIEYWHKMQMS